MGEVLEHLFDFFGMSACFLACELCVLIPDRVEYPTVTGTKPVEVDAFRGRSDVSSAKRLEHRPMPAQGIVSARLDDSGVKAGIEKGVIMGVTALGGCTHGVKKLLEICDTLFGSLLGSEASRQTLELRSDLDGLDELGFRRLPNPGSLVRLSLDKAEGGKIPECLSYRGLAGAELARQPGLDQPRPGRQVALQNPGEDAVFDLGGKYLFLNWFVR